MKSDANLPVSPFSLLTSWKVKQALSAIGLSLLIGNAVANDCDCTQTVGSCIASVEVRPTGNQKNLFGADLIFRANAPQCAKVEYYHGLTPAMTVLKNGRYGEDSLMLGPNPVSSDAITDLVCKICRINEKFDEDDFINGLGGDKKQYQYAENSENQLHHNLFKDELDQLKSQARRDQDRESRETLDKLRDLAARFWGGDQSDRSMSDKFNSILNSQYAKSDFLGANIGSAVKSSEVFVGCNLADLDRHLTGIYNSRASQIMRIGDVREQQCAKGKLDVEMLKMELDYLSRCNPGLVGKSQQGIKKAQLQLSEVCNPKPKVPEPIRWKAPGFVK